MTLNVTHRTEPGTGKENNLTMMSPHGRGERHAGRTAVVGLGAFCDLRPPRPDGDRARSFSVSEFATLADGERVTLHAERGFTVGIGNTSHIRAGLSAETMIQNVLNTVLPDDDDEAMANAHPWPWLAGLAQARGLDVTEEDLKQLPYEVILSDTLIRWLAGN